MRLSRVGLVVGALLALVTLTAQAREVRYAARMDQSQWTLQASRAQCVLSHAIPDYGQAWFIQRLGQAVLFSMDIIPEAGLADAVVIRSVPPAWNHRTQAVSLGQQPISADAERLTLNAADSQTLFMALERGQNLEIAYRPGSNVVVEISAVRFLTVMNDFYVCAAKLSAPVVVAKTRSTEKGPVTAQPAAKPVFVRAPRTGIALAYSSVEFSGGEDSLSEAALSTLTGIAREFLTQQAKKPYIVISGSSASDAVYKKRAAMISLHLVSQGVPAAAVTSISRGQLPKVKNVRPDAAAPNTLQIHLMQ